MNILVTGCNGQLGNEIQLLEKEYKEYKNKKDKMLRDSISGRQKDSLAAKKKDSAAVQK